MMSNGGDSNKGVAINKKRSNKPTATGGEAWLVNSVHPKIDNKLSIDDLNDLKKKIEILALSYSSILPIFSSLTMMMHPSCQQIKFPNKKLISLIQKLSHTIT